MHATRERLWPMAPGRAAAWDDDPASPLAHRLPRRLALSLALLLLAGAAALWAARIVYTDAVYPGVRVAGLSIGGQTRDDASAAVTASVAALDPGLIAFTYEGTTWTPSLADLGVTVDLDATIDQAFAIGREETARERVRSAYHLVRHDKPLALGLTLDEAALNAWFARVDEALGDPPRDAALSIEGTDVAVTSERTGIAVDRPAATASILDALTSLRPVAAPLPVALAEPRVRAADLEEARARLARALATPLKIRFERQTWTLQPAELAPFLEPAADPASFAFDEDRLTRWLSERFAPEINRDPVDAVIAWSAARERPIALENSVDGAKIKPRTFARAVAASFLSDHAPVDVPVVVKKPRVDDQRLGKLGITRRLAVGDSNYEGSNDGRATNIEVGVGYLNGTLVAPGESFSFNRAVDIINEERGFVEAQVIQGERIGRDIGGGICQVSTTVYRAALYAGLPITEWWPHTYRLAFYEQDDWLPGFDASILQPEGDPFGGGDFQFVNPTDSWLLIEAYADGARVVIIIYGPDTGYSVDISTPVISDPIPVAEDLEIVDESLPPGTIEQTEAALTGLEISYTRTVTGRDGTVVLQDEWPTRFAPRGNVWKVSPDMSGHSPAGQG